MKKSFMLNLQTLSPKFSCEKITSRVMDIVYINIFNGTRVNGPLRVVYNYFLTFFPNFKNKTVNDSFFLFLAANLL